MTLTSKLLAVAIVLSTMISCSKKDNPAPPNTKIIFKANMNGPQEGASNTSLATGQATLTYDSVTKIFSISVTHNITSPTNGHIHKGAVGVAGPVVFPFSSFTSPISYTSPVLDATQEADLKAGLYYVNIHTATYPGGEIRGQLIRQ